MKDISSYLKDYGETLDHLGSPGWGNLFKLSDEPSSEVSTRIVDLVSSRSRPDLSKVLLALAYLTKEMKNLNYDLRRDIIPRISRIYGDSVAELFPLIQTLGHFITYSGKLIVNIMNQLSAIYSASCPVAYGVDIHFQTVYNELSSLLAGLALLEEVLAGEENNHPYRRIWLEALDAIRRTTKDQRDTEILLGVLEELEEKILRGGIFDSVLALDFEKDLRKNKRLANNLSANVMNILDSEECDPRQFLEVSCLIRLIHSVFPSGVDRKIMNRYWDIACKVHHSIYLVEGLVWFPEVFMESLCDKKKSNLVRNNRNQYLSQNTGSAQSVYKRWFEEVTSWMLDMSAFSTKPVNDLKQRIDDGALIRLVLRGLFMAEEMRYKTALILSLHKKYIVPFAKSAVLSIFGALELLKMIERTFKERQILISQISSCYCHKLMQSGETIVERLKKTVESRRKITTAIMDGISALDICNAALKGPPTFDRRLVARLSLTIAAASPDKIIKEEDIHLAADLFRRLELFTEIGAKISSSTNASFFYFHRELMDTYLEHLMTRKELRRITAFLDILEDCHQSLSGIPKKLFENEVKATFDAIVLEPIASELETDIRLQVHSHLDLDDRNPYKVPALKDFSSILHEESWSFFDRAYVVTLSAYVRSYMEKTFYNQSTVAPHDWKTYSEMKALANHKYDLDVGDDYLPAQTLDQGLDVLEITKDLSCFTGEYAYNLNNQIFVQLRSKNKHLNCIGIPHISNSIRTHGIGILNTTVNATYKFLKSQIKLFSQFLYEEQIKSRLSKDAKSFSDNREPLDQKFPFERADKFNKGIRKLGIRRPEVGTKLDVFRRVITHIGNSMGLVRAIRSGGLRFISDAIRFIPDLKDIPHFTELCSDEIFSKESVESARVLDEVVENMYKKFGEKNEYFQLLVSVFSKQVQDEKQQHLKNFYVVVPALTINYIDHIISAKDNMLRKNLEGALFTDDGLAMGVAYILTLLKQWNQFESLNWFKSVNEHFSHEEKRARSDGKKSSDEKLVQTLALTQKRLQTHKREFELLYFNINSARIFFQKEMEEKESAESDMEISSLSSLKE